MFSARVQADYLTNILNLISYFGHVSSFDLSGINRNTTCFSKSFAVYGSCGPQNGQNTRTIVLPLFRRITLASSLIWLHHSFIQCLICDWKLLFVRARKFLLNLSYVCNRESEPKIARAYVYVTDNQYSSRDSRQHVCSRLPFFPFMEKM